MDPNPLRTGKVRDLFDLGDRLRIVTSDRISCFDCILLDPIPYKGAVLNLISQFWFKRLADVMPNHWISCPDSRSMLVRKAKPLPLEIIVRRRICGSLWRAYAKGQREYCGAPLPDNLKENQALPSLIVTPTTKNPKGHDENITPAQLVQRGTLTREGWEELEAAALELFRCGEEIAFERGLILVDTKYEFGRGESDTLLLIDEVHTPDSSRYWYREDLEKGNPQFSDKEKVRRWLMERAFMGDGEIPRLPPALIQEISDMYVKLFETLTEEKLPVMEEVLL